MCVLAAIGAAAIVLSAAVTPSAADDSAMADVVIPAPLDGDLQAKRDEFYSETQPKLTAALLAAYVVRQQELNTFDGFDVPAEQPDIAARAGSAAEPQGDELTSQMLLGYIARRQNQALDAIESVDITSKPALTADVLSTYADDKFVPTMKRVKLADGERLCLAQAIYYEARGESDKGQMAVANVIINRAMSKQYPSTICGVVFQNADRGRYKCQFTFACDGKADIGTERRAWQHSIDMADAAFHEFQLGERPGVVPNSAMYYHTTAVAPNWSHTFKRVASIGAHVFYAAAN